MNSEYHKIISKLSSYHSENCDSIEVLELLNKVLTLVEGNGVSRSLPVHLRAGLFKSPICNSSELQVDVVSFDQTIPRLELDRIRAVSGINNEGSFCQLSGMGKLVKDETIIEHYITTLCNSLFGARYFGMGDDLYLAIDDHVSVSEVSGFYSCMLAYIDIADEFAYLDATHVRPPVILDSDSIPSVCYSPTLQGHSLPMDLQFKAFSLEEHCDDLSLYFFSKKSATGFINVIVWNGVEHTFKTVGEVFNKTLCHAEQTLIGLFLWLERDHDLSQIVDRHLGALWTSFADSKPALAGRSKPSVEARFLGVDFNTARRNRFIRMITSMLLSGLLESEENLIAEISTTIITQYGTDVLAYHINTPTAAS